MSRRVLKLVLWLAASSPALAGWRIDGADQGGWSIDGAVQEGGGVTGGWLYLHGGEALDGSWRLGYDPAASNVVMQVRAGGVWTNSVQFLAP